MLCTRWFWVRLHIRPTTAWTTADLSSSGHTRAERLKEQVCLSVRDCKVTGLLLREDFEGTALFFRERGCGETSLLLSTGLWRNHFTCQGGIVKGKSRFTCQWGTRFNWPWVMWTNRITCPWWSVTEQVNLSERDCERTGLLSDRTVDELPGPLVSEGLWRNRFTCQ